MFRHVLVATDFSEVARQATHYAASALAPHAGQITLLTVVTDWQVPLTLYEFVPEPSMYESLRNNLLESATTRVKREAQELFPGSDVQSMAVTTLRPVAHEIVDIAARERCDLIVVGSQGSGAFGALVLGSVAQKVLSSATCPVLVVPRRVQYEEGSGR